VRKDLRDKYESKVENLQERLKIALGEDYTIEPSIDAIYPGAEAKGYGVQLGAVVYSYFDNAIKGVENLTNSGKDKEAVDLFNSLVPNRKFIIVLDKDAGYNYCGPRFREGDFDLVIHPDNVWSNVSNIAEDLDRKIDMALFKQKGELPLGVRRGVVKYLEPALARAGAKFKQMFGKDYTFEYDLLHVYKERYAKTVEKEHTEESWFRSYGSAFVPNMIGQYFEKAADGLEYKKFGKDEMLQEAFVEATGAGVIAFQLVDTLPSGYHGVKFEDDKLIIFTTAEKFASNINSEITEKVVDML